MTPLHKVTRDELPILLEWTAKYLPLSYKHYETIQAKIQGIWQGTPLYTLGWPDIRAVGEGPADSSECQCADYFNKFQATSVFSPNSEDLEELLTTPGFLDWTKPIIFYGLCHDNGDVVEKVSNATGTKYNTRYVNHAFLANPGDVVERTIPDGFHIRSLDPDLHSDYVASTWPHHRLHTNQYIAEVLKSFPSVGVFDSDGNCVGVELVVEWGYGSFLHVKDEVRGLGLASCIVSHLAQKRFQENKPFLAATLTSNKAAISLHEKLGFKIVYQMDWFVHSMSSEKVVLSQ